MNHIKIEFTNERIVPSKLPNGYVPVDIDVTPFDNSKTRKEGVSRTYKGYDVMHPSWHAFAKKNIAVLLIERTEGIIIWDMKTEA